MHKWRVLLVALMIAALFGLGIVLGVFVPRLLALNSASRPYQTATLLQQVRSLSQLVTVQYVMEKVVVVEDVKWFGGNRVLLIAHGVVKAGPDLGEITSDDLEVDGKKIIVKLPPARITDAYLDDRQTKVVERTTGLLRVFDKDLEQAARQNAVDDIRRAARLHGIQKDADERARALLKNLFLQLGFEEVEFRNP
jgi:hypothetical protein